MADPAIGSLSTLRIGIESAWGTANTNGNTIAYRSGGIKPAQPLNDNPNMRGDFSPSVPGSGKKAAQGTIAFVPTIDSIPYIFYWLFGNISSTDNTTYWTHVSTLADDMPLSMTVSNLVDLDTDQWLQGIGCRINSLTIPFGPDGFSEWSMEVMAKDATFELSGLTQLADLTTGEVLDNILLDSTDGVKIGGSTVGYVQSGSLRISANLFADDYRAGTSGVRGSLVPGKYTVDGSIKVALDSAAVLTLLGAGTPQAFQLLWNLGTNRTLTISLPATYFQKTGPDVQDGPLFADVSFKCAYDSVTGTAITTTVDNNQIDTIYTATS